MNKKKIFAILFMIKIVSILKVINHKLKKNCFFFMKNMTKSKNLYDLLKAFYFCVIISDLNIYFIF